MTQEEKYIDTLQKLREVKEAFDKLSDENKIRLVRDVLGATAADYLLEQFLKNKR